MSMRQLGLAAAMGLAVVGVHLAAQDVDPIAASAAALGAAGIKTLVYNGFGSSYFVGQNPSPSAAWPRVSLTAYKAEIDYDRAVMRVEMRREQGQIPSRGGGPVFAGERREIQGVSGTFAWNVPFGAPNQGRGRGPGASTPADAPPAAPPAPPARGRGGVAAVALAPEAAFADASLRAQQIWMTPHGFLRAAVANHASARRVAGGAEISFAIDGTSRFTGLINTRNEVQRVSTWVANPVLGDMLVDTDYHDYAKAANGVLFPMHITQRQGGHPALDLYVTTVEPNAQVDATIPDSLRDAKPIAASGRCAEDRGGCVRLAGRDPSQRRDRNVRLHRVGRGAPGRGAGARGHQQYRWWSDLEQADTVRHQYPSSFRPCRWAARPSGCRRDGDHASKQPGLLRSGVGRSTNTLPSTGSSDPARHRVSKPSRRRTS